ncbi:hypothetical protein [Streptomyces sp. NPDC048603]|uniref:hypothetical protein n=1 Tax=Streptomyces sp. NPDC048603 TaxID=3365577 RepID=UPI00371E790B
MRVPRKYRRRMAAVTATAAAAGLLVGVIWSGLDDGAAGAGVGTGSGTGTHTGLVRVVEPYPAPAPAPVSVPASGELTGSV